MEIIRALAGNIPHVLLDSFLVTHSVIVPATLIVVELLTCLTGRQTMTRSHIEYVRVATLRPWPRNPRTHSKKQVRQIADSISRFGFTNPVLIDRENTILAGQGRVEAAKLLRQQEVPCIRIETMSPAEKRAYVIADNRLALNAGWDEETLATELQALMAADIDFDIGLTGFSIAEIDNLVEGLACEEPGDPEDDNLPPEGPARCKSGDRRCRQGLRHGRLRSRHA